MHRAKKPRLLAELDCGLPELHHRAQCQLFSVDQSTENPNLHNNVN